MIVAYTDSGTGLKTARVVPDDAAPLMWGAGVLIGPPDLGGLNLPEEVTKRLHNELFHRGVIRRNDARNRRGDVHAALMAALKVDAEAIIALYEENANA